MSYIPARKKEKTLDKEFKIFEESFRKQIEAIIGDHSTKSHVPGYSLPFEVPNDEFEI